ncbi:MAG: hypothetical protein HY811_09120 [Planctomycetes bacterium]|nr:hypothetical protein [Planctomycetota bacterium]
MGKFIACLFFIACGIIPAVYLKAQEDDNSRAPVEKQQVIEGWSYSHYEKETLIWQAKGEKALISKNEYQLKTLVVTYYLGLEEGVSTPTDRYLVLSADDGVISQDNNTAVFKNNVCLEMPEHAHSYLDKVWKIRAAEIGIKLTGGKDKAPKEIFVYSPKPITLTQSGGITLTANSFNAAIIDNSFNTAASPGKGKTEFRKVVFTKALLIRLASAEASTGTNKTLVLKADIMELCDPEKKESSIALKGKKSVLLNDSPPLSNSASAPGNKNIQQEGEKTKVVNTSSVWITCEGDAFIYPYFHKIEFRNKVRAIQSSVKLDINNTPAEEPAGDTLTPTAVSKGVLTTDFLTLFLDPVNNEITKVRAEGNIILTNQENSVLSCETLDWLPEKQLITIKSKNEVKIWSKNNLITGVEAVIHTGASGLMSNGSWGKIELKGGNLSIPKENGK